MALVHPEKVADEAERRQLEDITFGYQDKKDYFVEKLAHGVGTIAAAFYPKPVIVRMSDFKTNEYAHLIGGTLLRTCGRESHARFSWCLSVL